MSASRRNTPLRTRASGTEISIGALRLALPPMSAEAARRVAVEVEAGLARLSPRLAAGGETGPLSLPPIQALGGESPESLGRRIVAEVGRALARAGGSEEEAVRWPA